MNEITIKSKGTLLLLLLHQHYHYHPLFLPCSLCSSPYYPPLLPAALPRLPPNIPPKMASADLPPKIYSFSQVSEHNHSKDCWLIIHGKVYDVSRFLEEHPGGDEVLLSATGKDATDDFEDVGHSTSAKAMMEEYYIGNIDSSTIPERKQYVPPKQAPYNPDKSTEFLIKILQFLVPIFILGLAFAVRILTKTKEE